MNKVAFLSMDSLDQFECYDHLLVKPMRKFGWDVETISWKTNNVDWKNFKAVIVRSTWDYQDDPDRFFSVLNEIDSTTRLENNIEVIKWNLNKNYLAELEGKGIIIVPSIFRNQFSINFIEEAFYRFETDEIIIKPSVSANADNTFRLTKSDLKSQFSKLNSAFSSRPFMLQPFMQQIVTEGEYSLFYFGGEYSHTVLKRPKEKDFRVQEEHGGKLKLVEPETLMKKRSEEILSNIDHQLLYARIDFVRDYENNFALMELELIEPSLYFNMDPDSPDRFAKRFDEWMKNAS